MLYQLDTNFTLLSEKSGVIENQSAYAMLEYATASNGSIPAINTGIRIMPGSKFKFALAATTAAFVRFIFVRAGDYTRQIAVVDDTGVNLSGVTDGLGDIVDAIKGHHCDVNVTVNNDCCCKHCNCNPNPDPKPDPPKDTDIDLIISDKPQSDPNILWGDPSNNAGPATGTVDGGNIVIGNLQDTPTSDGDIIWGEI